MILNTAFNLDAFLKEALEAVNSDKMQLDRVGGGGSPEEQLAAREALVKGLQGDVEIRTLCVACGSHIAVRDAAPCTCDGFVCAACQRVEPEGVCDHEPPDFNAEDLVGDPSGPPFDPFTLQQEDIVKMPPDKLQVLREIFELTLKSAELADAAGERIRFIDKVIARRQHR